MIRGSRYSGVDAMTYMFIDGAWLTEFAKAAGLAWYGEPAEINYGKLGGGNKKVFYYDCLPGPKSVDGDEHFKIALHTQQKHFDRLRSIDGWHVREGIVKRHVKGKAQQKEVDILIAVDMLTHAFRKNMDALTFVAGDLDFRPLLEAVVSDGMYVTLWTDGRKVPEELRDTADAVIELDPYRLHAYCTDSFQTAHPLPSRSRMREVKMVNPVEVHREGEQIIAWIEKATDGTFMLYWPNCGLEAETTAYNFHDLAYLKKICLGIHGEANWTSCV